MKNDKIKKVLVIGSGPIIIGQAAEFDYAGTQACQSLKEEGIEVVLVNSNPATIMTDNNIADRVYIQPITLEALDYIIKKERPDGLLASLGGQTGLNMAIELDKAGVLKKYNVKLLGTSLEAIKKAEDRECFKELMISIDEPVPKSVIVNSIEEGILCAEEIGFPIIVRPAFTLGGLGGGIAKNKDELKEIIHTGLLHSIANQVLLEQSLIGWKEIEFEVIRDGNDNCIIICDMENFDPVGIHTGDSIVVAPSQTLNNNEYKMLRRASKKIIRALGIEGGCNVQLALNPKNGKYNVIEVNPRVSRSSSLASKATGYPIAKIAAKIAIGLNLYEIKAFREPVLDYIVVKIPKWPFDKFDYADRYLGTQMKATGEVMAIDKTFESALLKAVISLEGKETGLRKKSLELLSKEEIIKSLYKVDDERIYLIAEALRKGIAVNQINEITKVAPWFIDKIFNIIKIEHRLEVEALTEELLEKSERMGFTDYEIQELSGSPNEMVDIIRRAHGLYPVYKRVNNAYYYSTYENNDENRISKKEKIIVIGSGPIRIGQGIEFDYCSVHAVWAIQKLGIESIIINNNPETVSTDSDISDKLYFEPLFFEDVYNVIRKEMPKGVIVQFGGQTAINLAPKLVSKGVQILGTSMDSIDAAEDRKRFERLLRELKIPQPKGCAVTTIKEAINTANEIGYPVLVRPSYVIGGRAMMIVKNEDELKAYVREATSLSSDYPILIDEYIEGTEVEVDAISDRENILIPGIMEHIERTGIHSGDSICVFPPQNLSDKTIKTIIEYTKKIAKALQVIGLMNIQFVVKGEKVYIIEVNPRASRTVPILSKVTKIPIVKIAIQVILGDKLTDLPYGIGLNKTTNLIAVKVPVFSFLKLTDVDVALTPEMKSTGEVLGVDNDYNKAILKAFLGAGYVFREKGKVLVSISNGAKKESLFYVQNLQKKGFEIIATQGTYEFLKNNNVNSTLINKDDLMNIQQMMKNKEIAMVINIPTKGKDTKRNGFKIRNLAEHLKIPCFTCYDTIYAYIKAMETYIKKEDMTYESIDYYLNASKSPSSVSEK